MLFLILLHVGQAILCEELFFGVYDFKDIADKQIIPENLSAK